ncbi:MAG TPA: ATP cone domain-containing protein, partial [Candidatus Wallbacteria bacterium]|nr:ATP cone domain-containing protein [Candidatus Wallbacteria bacterium]
MTATIEKVIKRNGSIVEYDKEKIVHAIFKAAQSVGGSDRKLAESIAAIESCAIDLLISDLRLPDGNGTEAIRRLRLVQPNAEAMVISVL